MALDYVTRDLTASGGKLNVPVSAAGDGSDVAAFIQGNPFTVDGSTQVAVEVYVAASEPDFQQSILASLYEGSTNVAVITDSSTGETSSNITRDATTMYGKLLLTPSAGTHTYAIRVWATGGTTNNVWSGTNAIGPGTAPKYGVAWYRVATV